MDNPVGLHRSWTPCGNGIEKRGVAKLIARKGVLRGRAGFAIIRVAKLSPSKVALYLNEPSDDPPLLPPLHAHSGDLDVSSNSIGVTSSLPGHSGRSRPNWTASGSLPRRLRLPQIGRTPHPLGLIPLSVHGGHLRWMRLPPSDHAQTPKKTGQGG